MFISFMFRVTNKSLKFWVYLLYCKIIECVLNIQCHYNKINQSINQIVVLSNLCPELTDIVVCMLQERIDVHGLRGASSL